MADHVDDECTADRCSLLTSMGVHVKSSSPSSTSSLVAAAATQQQNYFIKDFACEMRDTTGKDDEEKEDCTRCRESRDRKSSLNGGGSGAFWNGKRQEQQQKRMLTASLLTSGVALLMFICLGVYTMQQSRVSSLEMQELRERVQRLDDVCGVRVAAASGSSSRGSNSEGDATSPFLSASDSDAFLPLPPPPSRLPARQPNADNSQAAVLHPNRPDYSRQIAEDEDEDDSSDYVNGRDDDDEEEEPLYAPYDFRGAHSRNKRAANGKKTKKSKMCRRLQKCINGQKPGKKPKGRCGKMLQCLPPPSSPAPPPPAMKPVHFFGSYSKAERQKKFDREAPLRFDQEAEWMKMLYKDRSQQPIQRLGDGGYNVTLSGIYFVYTSVMFHDVKPRTSQAIVVNGVKRLKCMDSVDYVNKTITMDSQKKYKTCSISGLIHLRVSDRLEVQNLYAQTEIDQSDDSTYFGALLLFPLELKN